MTPLPRFVRLLAVGVRTHVRAMSRSPIEITFAVLVPLVYATMAHYLFRDGTRSTAPMEAALGAGLMGMWMSVLFGSGGAIQNQRALGVLETLVAAPVPLVAVLLPITLATAAVGTYSVLATLLWSVVLFGVPLTFLHPLLLLPATVVCAVALGMTGLLLASTFVLLRNANALANVLDFPVWLLSGLLVSREVLPGWAQALSSLLPTRWGAEAVQAAAYATPDVAGVLRPMGAAVVVGLLYLGLAVVALQRVERRARAAGTIALV